MATLTSNAVLSLGLVGSLSAVASSAPTVQLTPPEVLISEDVNLSIHSNTLSQTVSPNVVLTSQMGSNSSSATPFSLDSCSIVHDNEYHILGASGVFTSWVGMHSPVIWYTQNYETGSTGGELDLVESTSVIYPAAALIEVGLDVFVNTDSFTTSMGGGAVENVIMFMHDAHTSGQSINGMLVLEGQLSVLDLTQSVGLVSPIDWLHPINSDLFSNDNDSEISTISHALEINSDLFSNDNDSEISTISYALEIDLNLFSSDSEISTISYALEIDLNLFSSDSEISTISYALEIDLNLFGSDSEISILNNNWQSYLETVGIPTTQGISRILVEAPSDLNISEVAEETQQDPTDVSISECIVYTDFMKDFFDSLGRLEDFDERAKIDNYPVDDSEPIRIGIFDNYSLHTFRTLNDRYN